MVIEQIDLCNFAAAFATYSPVFSDLLCFMVWSEMFQSETACDCFDSDGGLFSYQAKQPTDFHSQPPRIGEDLQFERCLWRHDSRSKVF